jgi:hypothetical protein
MSLKALRLVKPLNGTTAGGLLNGTHDKLFQIHDLFLATPCRSMAYLEYFLTIARLHYHSGRQCL